MKPKKGYAIEIATSEESAVTEPTKPPLDTDHILKPWPEVNGRKKKWKATEAWDKK